MGFARPITLAKSNASFLQDFTFYIEDNEIVLKCLIDTGADKSLVNEDVVINYKSSFYDDFDFPVLINGHFQAR